MRGIAAGLAAALSLSGAAFAENPACPAGLAPMTRVELYFGAAGPPAAWTRFVRDVVTPRFPDGLTILEGYGQWRAGSGLRRERTHVLVVFFRRDRESDARIEAIRTRYKARFRQAAVLRAESTACVGF